MASQIDPTRTIAERQVVQAPSQPKRTDQKAALLQLRELLDFSRSSLSMVLPGRMDYSLAGVGSFAAALARANATRKLAAKPTLSRTVGPASEGEAARMAKTRPEASASASGGVPFGDLISSLSQKYGVDSALVAAVVKAESGFNPNAKSSAGAKGLMQLMDGTARSLGVRNSFDPEQNLDGGIRFLGYLLDKYGGDIKMALAGYNAGPGAVDHYGGVPPYKETQTFVSRVMDYARELKASLP